MMKQKFLLVLSLVCLFLSFIHTGYANTPLHVTFVPESFEQKEAEGFLVITIEKGWKLYAPSHDTDSLSYSPLLSWEGSTNLKEADADWPDSLKVRSGDLEGHVYKNAAILPVQFTVQDASQPLIIKGTLQGLICSDKACQPIKIPLNFTLTPHTVFADPQNQLQKILENVAVPLPTEKEGISLGMILLLALLGGLILNVMPCVLPVLGLKLMVFTKASSEGGFPTRELWMTVAGIYTTFIIFALITLVLKSLGETIGWGIHFQNPYFLSFMIVILILFTGNMLGFFEVATPQWTMRFASFNSLKKWKSFFSGVLSVLLATPCAAPFVGTAVGFALARQPFDIFTVFTALATGFSSPYWVTALLPSHKLPLPKAGPWILKFQRILSILLIGTIVWLLFLLSTRYSLIFGACLISLLGCVFLGFMGLKRGWKFSFLILSVSLILLLFSPLLPRYLPLTSFAPSATLKSSDWHPFHPEAIPTHVAQGKVVFVDLTASWCLTCHMNKKLVLESLSIKNLLSMPKVVRMRGDWTTPNSDIADFLNRFEKAGIPFNVVFGPNAPEGIVLPEILTTSDVTQAISQAKGDS